MVNVLVEDSYLSDIADAIRQKKSSEDTYKPGEMADAIMSIPSGTPPTGTISISTNGTHDVTNYAYASVSIPTGTARSSSDLTASNLTVTAPAGLYAENATKTLSDANLVAGNIKKDVTIFGTTGTYEGSGGNYVAADWGDPTKPTGEITITRAYATSEGDSCGNLMCRRSAITIVHMPNTTYLPHNYFSYSSLTKLDAPLLEEAGSSSISYCSSLTGLVLPKFRNSRNNGSFMNNGNLVYADFGGSTGGATMANLFLNCTKLNLLILRSSTVWTLTNTNAFNGTCFASGKTGGTLYVPQALISTYQSDTTWGTILGYANNQIKAIEGSIYENQYADGTPISS